MSGIGLHASEIECIMSRITESTKVQWLGVFARDELPDMHRARRPFALVFNTDPRSKPGQHWLAIFGPSQGPLELFDSFGLPLSFYNLDFFSTSIPIVHSNKVIQSPHSALCGHYCIYFLVSRIHSRRFKYIISKLSNLNHNRNTSDSVVRTNVHNLKLFYNVISPCTRTGQCSQIKCSFC